MDFGISFGTLIVLAVLAFILFGPQKLPEYAEKLGRWVAKMRQTTSELSQKYKEPLRNASFPDPAQSYKEPYLPFQEVTCPQCRQQVSGDFSFCPKCGKNLKESPEAPK